MKCNCECCHDWLDHQACGCCEGTQPATPVNVFNRPGLSQLNYRIGTHSRFVDSMLSRLSSNDLPQLKALSTRETDDPGIALLDACATLADVITFYQERIANEGYLRTARQRRSIMELANLPGYRLRPGVAASVYLAYTADQPDDDEVLIPQGSAVQSIPGPDELPQTFETSEKIKARTSWNNLQPRLTQPQTIASIFAVGTDHHSAAHPRLYLKGVNSQLKTNDLILIQQGSVTPQAQRIYKVIPDPDNDRTLVQLSATRESTDTNLAIAGNVVSALTLAQSVQPRNSLRLGRALNREFSIMSQSGYTALKSFAPQLSKTLASAAANAVVNQASDIRVYALRQKAAVFGHNTPKRTVILDDGQVTLFGGHGNWPVFVTHGFHTINSPGPSTAAVSTPRNVFHEDEHGHIIHLDAVYDGILPDSWIVISTADGNLTDKETLVVKVAEVDNDQTRSEYGMTGPATRINIGDDSQWIKFTNDAGELKSDEIENDFDAIRMTSVYAESERLELAEEPINTPICSDSDGVLKIELDGFYDGLESGRWVIVSGERDIPGTSGVMASELAMLASVEHGFRADLPGDSLHTTISFAEALKYCFVRDSVKIYGNVVKATHGETREEILGNGDALHSFQSFELKQAPLTFTAAPNPSGVDSSLVVRVNDIRWHEVDCLGAQGAKDRNFGISIDVEDKTTVIFGNGRNGARPPTGVANIRAEYRNGIGSDGNVRAEQISLLKSKPLGVKGVINPLRASGGAEREHEDQARHNIPLAVKALDRLVSVKDYEDFSRVYAGIGKASATEISDGRRQIVHLTVAGANDIPIDKTSDLYKNLYNALHTFGDPCQPVELAIRERLMMVMQARVKIHPDYEWESVSEELRETLLEQFSFASRELGQDVYLSEIFCVMDGVAGVNYVDIDAFGGVPEKEEEKFAQPGTDLMITERRFLPPETINQRVLQLLNGKSDGSKIDTGLRRIITVKSGRAQPSQRLQVNLAGRSDGEILIHPAQIAFFDPDVPATLVLNEIE